jgi:hypothetical protein
MPNYPATNQNAFTQSPQGQFEYGGRMAGQFIVEQQAHRSFPFIPLIIMIVVIGIVGYLMMSNA